ncbi:MAG: LysR family transcriptional regulator [Pigmentiphaga sp.]|nr:LysR family transcriptional regulator [Pigmentiphaga sp.]
MRDLDLTSLRLFVRVCEAGSITRVAEHTPMVGSAISKRLAQLEDIVGQPLLIRRRRGVEPTPAGQALLHRARNILAQCDGVARDMADYAAGVRGLVRISATASTIAERLAEDVADFLREAEHRDIRVELEEGLSHDVLRNVREGLVPLGVCWDAADFQELETRPYRGDSLVLIAPAGHPLAGRQQVTFAETLDHEHVALPAASAVSAMLRRAAAEAGRLFSQRVTVSNFDSVFRVVHAGLAVSVVPAGVAQRYAEIHGLAVAPLTDAWASRRFAVCMRSVAALGPAEALMLAFLVDRQGRRPHPEA